MSLILPLFIIVSLLVLQLESIIMPFPRGSVTGVLVAIAVPLDLPNYNVFMSYNFEANYNLPTSASDISQGPLLLRTRREVNNTNTVNANNSDFESETLNKNMKYSEMKPLITRKNVYSWIEDKLELYGHNGKECLLRAICDHSTSSFSKHNGFLGDIAHIILSPYTSKIEPDMTEYLQAEIHGKNGECINYFDKCDTDILSFISETMNA